MTHPGADEREPLYAIAVAARLTGMHPQTLRKYERAGLLRPARVSGNQRLYSDADLHRLTRIRYLVEERGLNVAGLEVTLGMVDRLDGLDRDATVLDLRAAIADALALTRDSARLPTTAPATRGVAQTRNI